MPLSTCCRDANYELTALPRLALHLNCALVSFHDKLDNAQTQSAPAAGSGHSLVHLVKPFEDPFRLSSCQTDSIVLNREDHVPVLRPATQSDLLLFPGIFERVVQQVH